MQAKIAASEYLIVLCSPNAAQSEWVDKEIRHFRETGRADKVLALIIAGAPNSGDEDTECFPPAFREREPLAANLVSDGRTSALTRIAAGLAGVPFDALWQRERRRQRRQMAFGGSLVALGLMLTAAAMVAGWLAVNGMADVERQSSNLIAREAKAVFSDESGDHTTSILMALQADPAARRNAIRHHFDGKSGYTFARARMETGVANTRLRNVFTGHGDWVTSVALTGDGRLVTGSRDGRALLWDLETGEEIRAFTGHESWVYAVALTGDGRLVTGSEDDTARLWELPAITLEPDRREQVRMACRMLHEANAPLWFTRADLDTYPVLDGEPRLDPDDPNSDFVSPCRCFLPDEVFEHPANQCPEGLPGRN
ncbi:MAG: TIR domain-containing protein [Pseudomonadota bacterium]